MRWAALAAWACAYHARREAFFADGDSPGPKVGHYGARLVTPAQLAVEHSPTALWTTRLEIHITYAVITRTVSVRHVACVCSVCQAGSMVLKY